MKKLLLMQVALLMGVSLLGQTAHDSLLGQWTNEDKTRVIQFVKSGDLYEGIIVKATDTSLTGKKQITGLRAAPDGSFVNGTIHVYQRNTTVSCTARLTSTGKLEFKARKGFVSKTQVWTKL